MNISPDVRYPVLGGDAPAPRRHRAPRQGGVGVRARGERLGVDIVEHAEVRGSCAARAAASRASRRPAARSASKVALAAAGHTSVLAVDGRASAAAAVPPAAGARVARCYEPVLDCVVMSNTVHVYVSQADKGELVMGAGIDPYNGYAQRGSFHVIEHQMAAAVELFPIFAHAKLLRTWGGIVDVCPDASPIVGPTPVEGLFLNCGWGTGGFKATPGSGWVYADTIANGEPNPLARPYALERFTTGALIDEHGAARGRALMGMRKDTVRKLALRFPSRPSARPGGRPPSACASKIFVMFSDGEREAWVKSTHDEQRRSSRWTRDVLRPAVRRAERLGRRPVPDGRPRRDARARHRGVAADGAEAGRRRVRRGGRVERAADPVPVVRPTRRDRVPVRRSGAHRVPEDPDALSDEEWADFLFMRDNPRGPFRERWYHVRGVPPMVQRGPGHGDVSVPRDVPDRRGAAGVSQARRRRLLDRPLEAARVPFRRRGVRGIRGRHARERAARERREVVGPQPDPRATPRHDDRRRRGAERLRRDQGAVVRPDRRGHDGRARRRPRRRVAAGRRAARPIAATGAVPVDACTGTRTSRRSWSAAGPPDARPAVAAASRRRPCPARGAGRRAHRSMAPGHRAPATTALGVVRRRLRRRPRAGRRTRAALARARARIRAGDRRHTSASIAFAGTTGPGDAGVRGGDADVERFGVLAGRSRSHLHDETMPASGRRTSFGRRRRHRADPRRG